MLPDDLAGPTRSSWAAAPATCRPGWRGAGARPSASTTRPGPRDRGAPAARARHLDFPLLLGNAERVPYPDASFDFAISEYGAVLWADPERWVPEAARLLRPGGRLHVLTNLCSLPHHAETLPDAPLEERLARPTSGRPAMTGKASTTVEFHLTHGDWIRLFRATDFEVDELLEPQVPEGAETGFAWAPIEWARRWPIEEIWKVRKRG